MVNVRARACIVLLLALGTCAVEQSSDCKGFQCFDGKDCIATHLLCNGFADCKDGSDEYRNCSLTCDMKRCDFCRPQRSPSQDATCECDPGHERSSESTGRCQDIDECDQQPPPCSQKCRNLPGTYLCRCEDGYTLAADGYSCMLDGEPKLAYGTRDDIHSLEIRKKDAPLKYLDVHGLQDMAFNMEHTMFYTEFDSRSETSKIYKVVLPDISKSRIHPDFDFKKITSLQYDVRRENLYILDSGRRAMVVCSTSACTTIYTEEQLGRSPSEMVLHGGKGVLFWVTSRPHSTSVIMSGGMDGRQWQPLVNVTGDVIAMALDATTDQLYYYIRQRRRVDRIGITSTPDQQVVLTTKEVITSSCLVVFEDKLIWADKNGIKAAHKFTGEDKPSLAVEEPGIVSLHVAHMDSWQPEYECILKRCSNICLVGKNKEVSCACPSGYEVSGLSENECTIILNGNPVLLASSGNQIEVLRPASARNPVSTLGLLGVNVRNLGSLVWLPSRSWIFFSQNLNGQTEIARLQSVNFERGTASGYHRVLGNLEAVESLVVDESRSILFFLNKDDEGFFVEMASMDGKWRTTVATEYEQHYLGLALSENKVFISTLNPPRILQCKLRQAELRCDPLVSVDLARPASLVVTGGMLYWADVDRREISRIEINTRAGRRTTLVNTSKAPLSVVVSNSTIFWTQESTRAVQFQIMGGVRSEIGKATAVLKLAMVSKGVPSGRDGCSDNNGGCDHICWNGQCLCDSSFHLADDDKSCVESFPECDGLLCDDGQCEPLGKHCDDFADCADGSDERNCKGKCDDGDVACHDQQGCYHPGYRCDGEFDCEDESDEWSCSCEEDEFDCGGEPRHCILNMFVCDEDEDCADGKDERQCGTTYSNCDAGQFACHDNRTCIPLDYKCDGQKHCSAAEDEEGCDANSKTAQCEDFACYDGTCLSKQLVCDGHKDCPRGEDENWIHCPEDTCNSFQFQCSNEQCIHKSEKCDGRVHCEDGSDESSHTCPSRVKPVTCLGFQCGNGKCIAQERVCDKDYNCDDGSDEINCNETCDTMSCPHACQMTPNGPRCVCPPGQEMRPGRVCLDINECKTRNGNCSHICVNHFGSYRCDCPAGYVKMHHHCKAQGPRHTMYAATSKGVTHIAHNGYSQSLVVRLPYLPLNLDVDIHTKTIYWTALLSNRNSAMAVYRSTGLQGEKVEKVAELNNGVSGLAVDWLTGNIFFSKSITSYKGCICVMDPVSGHQKMVVISTRPITKIALHPQRGEMYWLAGSGRDGFSIVKGSMAGSHAHDVVKMHEHPGSLVLDPSAGRMYWHSGHTVETAKLDGSDRFPLATNLPRILSLDVFGGVVHYSTGEGVQEVTADHPEPHNLVTGQAVGGVKISQDLKQPRPDVGPDGRSRQCTNKCDFLCVLVPHFLGHTSVTGLCLCPDGFVTDESGNCRDPNATTVATTTPKTQPPSSMSSDITREEKTTAKTNCPLNCKNGGKCTYLIHIWICSCPRGFKGRLCQTSVETKVTKVEKSSLWWIAVLITVLIVVALLSIYCCIKRKSFDKFYMEYIKYNAGIKDDTTNLVDENSYENPNYQDEIHRDLHHGNHKEGKPKYRRGSKPELVPDDNITTALPGM